jgi:diguanylate cyclase (GGDEF)-like protein/PAS domain S-box-containing protein
LFKLKKYFVLSGGSAFLAFILIFAYGLYNHDTARMRELGERENLLLAGYLSELLQDQIHSYVATRERAAPALPQRSEIGEIDQIIRSFSSSRPIHKVKLFDPQGLTLYSSAHDEIGLVKVSQGIQVARERDRAYSEIAFKGRFQSLAGSLENRDIVETYIPIHAANGDVIAIFELYSDITDLIRSARASFYRDLALLFAIYLVLFLFLYLVVRRADGIIKEQYRDLQNANDQLEIAKTDLGRLVEQRTRDLSDTVDQLEIEIKERQQAELELSKLTVAIEQSPSAILITDPAGIIQYANPRFSETTGWSAPEVVGQHSRMLAARDSAESIYETLWDTIKQGEVWKGEIYNLRKDGQEYLASLTMSPIHNENNDIIHYLAISEDITRQKEHEARIFHLAHHDNLTGLLNRFSLESRLEQALAQAARYKTILGVLFLDLDRFKSINDSLGHKAGDLLLKQVAERLSAICKRKSDLVARLGGDEFVIVLSDIQSPTFAALTARAIVEVLSLPFECDHDEIRTSTSVGISIYPADGDGAEQLLKNADAAMYHAKDLGRGNYQFYTEDLNQAVEERLILEKALRQAIAEQSLELHYQPQVCVVERGVCGVEALLRWNHPELGFVSPEKFIALAEEVGLIQGLGLWVIKTALMTLNEWQQQGISGVRMAVNVSARQLVSDNFVAEVEQLIVQQGIDPAMLELEITESAAMDDPAKAIEILQRLRALGIELAIDDFGTGYSSLSYLKMFPIQALKLDRAFVMNLEHDENNAAISRAAISLAHDLGFKVVAEGVETLEQVRFLQRTGCDMLQGYYFSKARPSAEIVNYIAQFQMP